MDVLRWLSSNWDNIAATVGILLALLAGKAGVGALLEKLRK